MNSNLGNRIYPTSCTGFRESVEQAVKVTVENGVRRGPYYRHTIGSNEILYLREQAKTSTRAQSLIESNF